MAEQVSIEQGNGIFVPEMPYAPESQVLAPYAFARTCMFSATRFSGNAVRPEFTPSSRPLHDRRGILVQQIAGKRLDKQDEDVALELMRRALVTAKPGDREVWVHVSRAALIKSLDWTRGGSSHAALEDSLQGLTDARFLIVAPGEDGEVRTMDTRISLKRVTTETPQGPARTTVDYEILLDVELFELLRFNQWCYLDPRTRAKLAKFPLAKLLHAYFSSYSVGRWLSLDELREMADRDELKVELPGKKGRETVLRHEERNGRWRAKVLKNIEALHKVDPRWSLRLNTAENRVYCDRKPGKRGVVEDVKTKSVPKALKKSTTQAEQASSGPLTLKAKWLEARSLPELIRLVSALGYRVQCVESLSDRETTELLRQELMRLDMTVGDLMTNLRGDHESDI